MYAFQVRNISFIYVLTWITGHLANGKSVRNLHVRVMPFDILKMLLTLLNHGHIGPGLPDENCSVSCA